jgi:hypothetical protein
VATWLVAMPPFDIIWSAWCDGAAATPTLMDIPRVLPSSLHNVTAPKQQQHPVIGISHFTDIWSGVLNYTDKLLQSV